MTFEKISTLVCLGKVDNRGYEERKKVRKCKQWWRQLFKKAGNKRTKVNDNRNRQLKTSVSHVFKKKKKGYEVERN